MELVAKCVEALRLGAAIERILVSRGLSLEHAADGANALVETSLLGIDTHGVRLLPTYLLELEGGRANCRPRFQVTGTIPAAGVFDGDNALGVVSATAAMRCAIERARQYGIASMAVANSNHFGAAGHYARMAAREDMIGLVFSNSDALVIPADGTLALNGTNPIAAAAPGLGEDGFFLDMATSEIAYSRMRAAETSVVEAFPLRPLGGYKGQGLGTFVQIVCAILASMPFDVELSHLYQPPYDKPRQVSHFMIAIKISSFIDPKTFRARVSELLSSFRESVSTTDEGVMVAGDREAAMRRQRLRDGIPLTRAEFDLLAPFIDAQELLL